MDKGNYKGKFNYKKDILTRRIIRELSQNARLSITELSTQTESYRRLILERLKNIEVQLGIRYTVEFNESVIGLNSPHIVLVKLEPDADYEEITAVLSESYVPQMAALTKGQYDMIIYGNAPTSSEYVHWDKTTQVKLSKYVTAWEPSDISHRQLGFFPLRNELLQKLKLPEEYMSILLELNQNSRIPFSKLSKKLEMPQNSLAYRFRGMMKEEYIKRFTLVMDKPNDICSVSIFGKYAIKENFEADASRHRPIFWQDEKFPLINKYIIVHQLVGSWDWFCVGIFDSYDTAYKEGILPYKKNHKRHLVKLRHAEIKKVILGRLPIRSLDAKQEFNLMKWI